MNENDLFLVVADGSLQGRFETGQLHLQDLPVGHPLPVLHDLFNVQVHLLHRFMAGDARADHHFPALRFQISFAFQDLFFLFFSYLRFRHMRRHEGDQPGLFIKERIVPELPGPRDGVHPKGDLFVERWPGHKTPACIEKSLYKKELFPFGQ